MPRPAPAPLKAVPIDEEFLMSPTTPSSLDGLPRTSDRLADDILLPQETVGIRSEAREFAQRVLAPHAAELNYATESSAMFPRDINSEMAKAGLYGVLFPADVGGRGLQYPMLAAATVLEELAYFTPGVASALFDAQVLLIGRTLDVAPAHLRAELLPRLVRGEMVGSFATSEPAASTDLSVAAMRTSAAPVKGGYRLTGCKRWITNACAADIMAVLCVVEGSLAMLLVDMRADGVVVHEPDLKMGNRVQLTSDVEFDNVFVPDAAVALRRPSGKWHPLIHNVVLIALPIYNAVYVGVAEAARNLALEIARRKRDDRFVQVLAGEMENELTAAQLALSHMIGLAMTAQPGPQTSVETMCCRAILGRSTRAAVDKAMELAGGASFFRSARLERLFRDVQAVRFHPVQDKPQAALAGRFALGLPLDE